jgi:hypothetical protein
MLRPSISAAAALSSRGSAECVLTSVWARSAKWMRVLKWSNARTHARVRRLIRLPSRWLPSNMKGTIAVNSRNSSGLMTTSAAHSAPAMIAAGTNWLAIALNMPSARSLSCTMME